MAIFLLQNGIPLNDLFFEHKKPHEKFGIATFHKSQFIDIIPTVPYFLEIFIPTWFKIAFDETRPLHETGWEDNLSFYTKIVLLADEYIKNDRKFDDLMSAHYNPDENLWEIHPGAGRKLTYELFGPDTIDCLTFDPTGQTDIKFKELFNTNKELQDYCLSYNNKEAFIPIHPAYNTYNPHAFFDGTKYFYDLEILFYELRLFWKTHSLKHNLPKYQNMIHHTVKNSGIVDIQINDINDIASFCRAMVLAPKLTSDYHDVNMSINIGKNN